MVARVRDSRGRTVFARRAVRLGSPGKAIDRQTRARAKAVQAPGAVCACATWAFRQNNHYSLWRRDGFTGNGDVEWKMSQKCAMGVLSAWEEEREGRMPEKGLVECLYSLKFRSML